MDSHEYVKKLMEPQSIFLESEKAKHMLPEDVSDVLDIHVKITNESTIRCEFLWNVDLRNYLRLNNIDRKVFTEDLLQLFNESIDLVISCDKGGQDE